MSRPLRILYPYAWYHVMNRGAARVATFHENDDYKKLLDLLLRIHRRYQFEIHAYCLMPNHYHLLLRTPLENLNRGMQYLNSLYTQYYNKKYGKDGALFRGRYKAILVDAENYLLRLSRYIHLNPIKSRLTKHPAEYPWSSYRFYSGDVVPPAWLHTKETLACFGAKQNKNQYALFIMGKTDRELETFYRKIKLLPILGSDAFRKQIDTMYLKNQNVSREISGYKDVCPRPSLEQICATVANYYHISAESLHLVNRILGNLPRSIAIYLAAELSGKKFEIIADFFKSISGDGISQIIRRVNILKSKKISLARDIEYLCRYFSN